MIHYREKTSTPVPCGARATREASITTTPHAPAVTCRGCARVLRSDALDADAAWVTQRAGERAIDPRPGAYFVTAIDGPRVAYLSGPYPTHAAALDALPRVKDLALALDARAAFAAFGACRLEDGHPGRVGVLQRGGFLPRP